MIDIIDRMKLIRFTREDAATASEAVQEIKALRADVERHMGTIHRRDREIAAAELLLGKAERKYGAAYDALECVQADIGHAAAIAHCGGLAKLSDSEALTMVRYLTKPYCNNEGTLADLKKRVDAAISAAVGDVP